MSVCVTGDTNGLYYDIIERISANDMQKEDSIIITVDFGFISGRPDKRETFQKIEEEDYRFWFIDGNDENFPLLWTYLT